ncbi:PP2C family protein-serine/threonine phosphatase [Oceanospirillum sediminis]|uniref:SpoIIE family protein phosphatase n=1 Tax=Oceanospirillum sediminis TaxID=2760088 RepID=A0A839IQZ0_9GAMM|nr:SpoIIE family protein phosphatase [Oceanospirillum sediminis]MBB1487084.1 SpoIIE family protein phosphatase [Oceanospirillum sediminis]
MLSTIADAVFIPCWEDTGDLTGRLESELSINSLTPDASEVEVSSECELVLFYLKKHDDLFRLEKWLRSDRHFAVILLAEESEADDVLRGMEAGADDYVLNAAQHFNLVSLVAHRAVARRRETRQNRQTYDELEQTNLELMTSLDVLRQDQQAGRYVQQKMLPKTPWEFHQLNFEHKVCPSLYLSGDFVDYFPIDRQRVLFYLADVSGHGASSAFITILLRVFIRRFVTRTLIRRQEVSPGDVLSELNKEILLTGLGKHVTIFLAMIDSEKHNMRYCNGAQYPAPVLVEKGEATFLEGKGMPVGLFDDAVYEEFELLLQPGYYLSLFSDGVFELMDRGSLAEKEAKLLQLSEKFAGNHSGLVDNLAQMGMEDSPDDVTLMTVSGC